MKVRITLSLVVVLVLTLAIISASYNFALSKPATDKKYCYDQVGEHHFCFDTKEKCKHEQKHNDKAETPCYNKNRQ
jgi:hypothetical protein